MRRFELRIQSHICDSYKLKGGYGTKWDAAHAKGKPDLVCSLPGYGAHFVEVKHRPNLYIDELRMVRNQLEARQIEEARRMKFGGCDVIAGLVIGGENNVLRTHLAYFDPLAEIWDLRESMWAHYVPQLKYDVAALMEYWRNKREL